MGGRGPQRKHRPRCWAGVMQDSNLGIQINILFAAQIAILAGRPCTPLYCLRRIFIIFKVSNSNKMGKKKSGLQRYLEQHQVTDATSAERIKSLTNEILEAAESFSLLSQSRSIRLRLKAQKRAQSFPNPV